MKIKPGSWTVVLVGVLTQLIVGMLMLSGASATSGFGGVGLAIVGTVITLSALIGIVPMILLAFKKTRKFGAVISVILGIMALFSQAASIVGVSLIIAGVLAIKKDI